MGFETVIGIGASILTSTSLIPQLIKILKEKKSKDISIAMLVVLFIGLAFWVWYGFLKNDPIIIGSNVFALLINLLIVIITIYYKPKQYE